MLADALPSSPKLTAAIDGIGLFGPGLPDWPTGRAILAGRADYVPHIFPLHAPASLPAAERRRTSKIIKLALTVGLEAAVAAGLEPASLPTVFATSNGDGYNCDEICSALASADRQISPTRFHNSVNNAPAGYWSIAAQAMPPSFVLCAFDASFGAGLLEALAQVAVDGMPTLLIAYDAEYPEPLRSCRPVLDSFGVALLLSPTRSAQTLVEIAVALTDEAADTLADERLEQLRRTIPIARSLPLLQAIAQGGGRRAVLDYLAPARLAVELGPWV